MGTGGQLGPNNVRNSAAHFRTLCPLARLRPDSAKTYGNPAHETACQKRMSFLYQAAVIGLVIWRVRERVEITGKAADVTTELGLLRARVSQSRLWHRVDFISSPWHEFVGPHEPKDPRQPPDRRFGSNKSDHQGGKSGVEDRRHAA